MATFYWVPSGGTSDGNWNSTNTANWASTSGGAGGAGRPVSGDNAVFDGNSDNGTGFTVTIVATGPTIRNLTISGLDQTMALAGSAAIAIQGNISLPATNFTWSATGAINLTGTASSRTILTNGVTIGGAITMNSAGSDWTLQSALTLASNRNLILTNGSFSDAGYSVTCQNFASNNSNTRALTMTGTWTTLGSGASAWNLGTSTGMTLTATGSTIVMAGGAAKAFEGGGLTYGTLKQGGGGTLTFGTSDNTFADIQNAHAGASTIVFTAGQTQTVNAFTLAGSAGNIVTIQSSSAGSAFTLSKASGTVSVSYLSIKDSTATGGATWNANDSTDAGGNTGWNFIAAPAIGNFFLLFV